MTTLERAARAAYDGHGFKPRDDMGSYLRFDQLARFQQENWFNAARAVLLAVREPDKDVKEKLAFNDYSTLSYGGDDSFYYLSKDNVAEFSRDLIDAILEDK